MHPFQSPCFGNRCIVLAVLTLALVLTPTLVGGATPESSDQNILDYAGQTVEWYREATGIDQATHDPQELSYRNNVRQHAAWILHRSFVYGKAEADLHATQRSAQTAPATSDSGKLAQRLTEANERVAKIQTELDQVTALLAKSSSEPSSDLTARRDKLVAQLSLANTRRDVVQNFAVFSGTAAGGLYQKLDELEKSMPDAERDAKNAAPTKSDGSATSASQNDRPESMGIFGMITEMFTLSGRMSEVKKLEELTDKLKAANDALRAPIRAELKAAVSQGDALSKTDGNADVKSLNDDRQRIDALVARYKAITAAMMPLVEQGILIDTARGSMVEWHELLKRDYHRTIRSLLIRLGSIAGAIFVLLIISAVWRQATFRYVTDIRRRRQFLLVRRMLVSAVIVLIVICGMVSEISSLATFAGLITAGVAVALQTVILSGVAHFFFMGRYGVRVGDRVTISGITGDVIDMGVFRLYLMELGGAGRDLQPTGRIVVFSNAVLFQSSAFFKQIPGAEYTWHEMALTLAPDTDHLVAEKRLLDTVNAVVDTYRPAILAQYKNLKESIHFPLPPPEPQGRLRFVDTGVEFVVRYPVEINRTAEIDDLMTRRLIDAIAGDPNLKLVGSKSPNIQPVKAS